MSSFFMVPINESGIVVDPAIKSNATNAMDPLLNVTDVFVYSHGWSTDADGAMALYNRFSIEFTRWLAANAVAAGLSLPGVTLSVGIHWPSEIIEDGSNVPAAFKAIIGNVQPLTFYTMKKRADIVGENGVYAVIRQLISSWGPRNVPAGAPQPPLTFNLIGHSFGCKVVCSAMQAIIGDINGGTIVPPPDLRFNVVLIEGAFENTYLDPGAAYGDVPGFRNLRMLITTSQLDTALTQAFPLSHELIDFFGPAAPAIGAGGPTAETTRAFGGRVDVAISPDVNVAAAPGVKGALVVADLTPLHRAHPENNGWGGHHSDFNYAEVYGLVAGFL